MKIALPLNQLSLPLEIVKIMQLLMTSPNQKSVIRNIGDNPDAGCPDLLDGLKGGRAEKLHETQPVRSISRLTERIGDFRTAVGGIDLPAPQLDQIQIIAQRNFFKRLTAEFRERLVGNL